MINRIFSKPYPVDSVDPVKKRLILDLNIWNMKLKRSGVINHVSHAGTHCYDGLKMKGPTNEDRLLSFHGMLFGSCPQA